MRRFSLPSALLTCGVLFALCGFVRWKTLHDDRFPFLSTQEGTQWIVYPKPPDLAMHWSVPLWAVFTRSFELASNPPSAVIKIRTFKEASLLVNGQPVYKLGLTGENWKSIREADITELLRTGENEISVIVSNKVGPPALWLKLETGELTICSDTNWLVSLVNAVWQKAACATDPPIIRPGNQLFARETIKQSIRTAWPTFAFIAFAWVSVLGIKMLLVKKPRLQKLVPSAEKTSWIALVTVILCWVVLLANNIPHITPVLGFDRDGHLEYVNYILQEKKLPLADKGWQTYQPPLYYILCAGILKAVGLSAYDDAAIIILRSFSGLCGVLHVTLVFLILRLLFRDKPSLQIAGLLVVAFLPAHLIIAHHVTNELLAALLATAALYFCLKIPHTSSSNPIGLYAATGVFLGAAILTKFSTVLVVPIVIVAMLFFCTPTGDVKLTKKIKGVCITLVVTSVVCGWHYWRVWRKFGSPLIGNWDTGLTFSWWQEPGYRTTEWFTRFGETLTTPLFSGLHSFADGLYTTLWGDGLCSGSALLDFRPQWNFDLMNIGYLLAIPATVLTILGGIVAIVRLFRTPKIEPFLMLGSAFAFLFGITFMTLRVASYAQVKAFYGLAALGTISYLVVTGWDWLTKRNDLLRLMLWAWLLIWATTVFLSLWINTSRATTYVARGKSFMSENRYEDAIREFRRALRLDERSVAAHLGLAQTLRFIKLPAQARQHAELALELDPANPNAHIEFATLLWLADQRTEAIDRFKYAIKLAPDHLTVYQQLAACYEILGRNDDVVATCREGLRVTPMSSNLHLLLAAALARNGDLQTAFYHANLAVALDAESEKAHRLLATVAQTIGKLDTAIAAFEAALRLKPNDAQLHYLYATALTVLGKITQAIKHHQLSLQINPDAPEPLNDLAWIYATAPNDALRNGEEAIRLARRACELTSYQEPLFIGTLAAAYAEAGRFDDAILMAEKARALAMAAGQTNLALRNEELLKLYRTRKPYRDPSLAISNN